VFGAGQAADVADFALAFVEHVDGDQRRLYRRTFRDRQPVVETQAGQRRDRFFIQLQRLFDERAPWILFDRADITYCNGQEAVEIHCVAHLRDQAKLR